jgi:Transglutaminase-like superfamily
LLDINDEPMKRFHLQSPPAGWFAALLASLLVLTPGFAASQNPIAPPATPMVIAGLLGLLIGYDYAKTMQRQSQHSWQVRAIHITAHVLFWLLGGLLLLLASGNALAPFALITQDITILLERTNGVLGSELRTPLFLSSSVARLLNEIGQAPSAGELGARLLLGLIGTVSTWAAAIALGHGIATPFRMLARVTPLLIALMLVAIPGGTGGFVLAFAMLIALLLVASSTTAQQIQFWETRQVDYSDELSGDIRLWAGLLIGGTLFIAWVIPLWPGNPVSAWMATIGESPSGVAALERGIDRSGFDSRTDRIGLSSLPSLRLGNSIAQGPPQQVALDIRLNVPLPAGTVPYWRIRLLEQYRGNDWASQARVAQQAAIPIQPTFAGAVVQTITDRRPDKQLVVALPDMLASSIPIRTERLSDGSLAAAAGTPPESTYTILSRLQALAPLPERDQSPPDMAPYLVLPGDMPPRVRELAAAIVAGQRDPTEQALALEAYLRTLPYTYEVQALPADGDAVDQFLFDMRSGYCTYYASAMAIMARSVGIPARIAVGYTTGELQPENRYLVREADAHAWPELYINERWQMFEPTPIRQLPNRGTEPSLLNAQPVPQPSPTLVNLPWLWMVAGVIVLAALGAFFFLRPHTTGQNPPDVLTLAARDLEQAGARIGIPWPRGSTLREYREMLIDRANQTEPIRQIVSLIEQGRYTGKPLNAIEIAQLEAERERLRQDDIVAPQRLENHHRDTEAQSPEKHI